MGVVKIQGFGSNIRRFRKAANLTQEELAELAKIAPRVLQRIESGRANTKIATLESIASALGVTLVDFFSSEGAHIPSKKSRRPSHEAGDISFLRAADVLAKLSSLKPARKAFVLALILKDESLLDGVGKDLHQAYQALEKAP